VCVCVCDMTRCDIFVNCNWVWHPVAVVQCTQTIHRTTKNKQYIEQHKNFGRVRAVPRLGELYPGICLKTEEKARKTLSQGSRTIRIHTYNNKNT
jgi:hypothetical protein